MKGNTVLLVLIAILLCGTLFLSMQKLVDLLNLLLYSVLSKLSFRFCPPFVHENINLFFRGHFFI